MVKCPFTIIIDTAEQHPFTFRHVKADADKEYELFEVQTVSQCLGRHPDSYGDYSLVGGERRCCVERKSQQDFYSTILGFEGGHRDRFEKELENLSKVEAPLLVIECTRDQFLMETPELGVKTKQQNAKILYRSILAFEQDYRVPIEWSGSREQAEHDSFRWMYRFWEKKLKPLRTKKPILDQQQDLPLVYDPVQLLNSI